MNFLDKYDAKFLHAALDFDGRNKLLRRMTITRFMFCIVISICVCIAVYFAITQQKEEFYCEFAVVLFCLVFLINIDNHIKMLKLAALLLEKNQP